MSVRALFLALAVQIALAAPARAEPFDPSDPADPVPGPLVEKLRWKRRLAGVERAAGWTIAGAGFVTIACGVVLFATSYSPLLHFEEGAANRSNGLITTAVGIGVLAPGLLLAFVGQRHITDLDWRLKELAVQPLAGPIPGGFLVGTRLRF